jgi:membrane-associated protease RseP (regulator of RpoE activity)
MAQIERLLPIAMAKPEPGEVTAPPPVVAAAEPESAGTSVPVPLPSTAPRQYTPAFARIDEVAAAGPAAAAGLCVGDELVSFGGLTASDLRANGRLNLQPLALKVRESEGSVLLVVTRRAGQYHELSLTPMAWEGQGLLGCHLQPL